MRAATASIPALLAVFARTAYSCVELQGIVAEGGQGVLDLSFLQSEGILTAPLAPINLFIDPSSSDVAQCSSALETPVRARFFSAETLAVFSLGNMFRPNGVALDIFGDKETSDARRRCLPGDGDMDGGQLFDLHLSVAFLYAFAYGNAVFLPECADAVAVQMERLGTPLSLVFNPDGDNPEPSTDTPWGLGKAYVDEIFAFFMANDGWNADGGLGGQEFNRTPFTGDFSYADSAGNEWNGYTPRNTPYEFEKTQRWQPLRESNGIGFITTPEHVTPHIGVTSRFFGFSTAEDEKAWGSRQLVSPPYANRHAEVAREVLEESAITGADPVREFAVSFFDNTFSSVISLMVLYTLERADTFSVLDYIDLTSRVQLAGFNSVVLAWREKVRHDAPRPPSVVRNVVGDETVEAYAGPGVGVQNIMASEWEPFIRHVPHSEYPSGSSCMCEAFAEMIQLVTETDVIDPPLEFPPPSLGGPIVTFSSWSEMSQMCGDSRVWGGMNFAGAVPAAVELCGGNEMPTSVAASLDALTAGDVSAAVLKRDLGDLMLRPL